MSFDEFVAIKLEETPYSSIAFKSLTSYIQVSRENQGLTFEESLKLWLVTMIDKGHTEASRKRYVEKLGSIYKEYRAGDNGRGEPFEAIKKLRGYADIPARKEIETQTQVLRRIFNSLEDNARKRPELALFLYLFFNASSDIESAISLTVEDYDDELPQLEDIIDTAAFHHRRKYVFDLGQSRKRMPQIVKEVSRYIEFYLSSRGLRFSSHFTPDKIVAMWIPMARKAGLELTEIKSVVDEVPQEFGYISFLDDTDLTFGQKQALKRCVAEWCYPVKKRWYALKLRRSSSFEEMQRIVNDAFADCCGKIEYFYPTKEVAKRVGKKIVKESVPFIRDIVFVRTRNTDIVTIDRIVRSADIAWTYRQGGAQSDYSIIEPAAMAMFQRAVGSFTSDMRIDLVKGAPVGIGRKVRITGGIMAGYTGTIYDIKPASDTPTRLIYVRLSEDYGIKFELQIEENLLEGM